MGAARELDSWCHKELIRTWEGEAERIAAPLREPGLPLMVLFSQTLLAQREEIAFVSSFTSNNVIPKGFHTVMELINRQAFGFRNFENYRMRVKVLCG